MRYEPIRHYTMDDVVIPEVRIAQLNEELAVWRRHGVLVTEDCRECEGGVVDACLPGGCGESVEDCAASVTDECPVCDGSGKVLRDGAVDSIVVQILRAFNFDSADEDVADAAVRAGIASWLEGASDE